MFNPSASELDKMIELYKSGTTLGEIGDIFDAAASDLRILFHSKGVEIHHKGVANHPFAASELDASHLKSLFLDDSLLKSLFIERNLNPKEIARLLGCSINIIKKSLTYFGIKKRHMTHRNVSRAIRKHLPGNLTLTDTALKLDINRLTVRSWIKQGRFPNAFEIIEGRKRTWLIPESDLHVVSLPRNGVPRKKNPSEATILNRGMKATTKIKKIYGLGKIEIIEMIELEKNGSSRDSIAEIFGIEQLLVSDILDMAVIKPLRLPKQKPAKRELKRLPKDLLYKLYVEEEELTETILKELNTNYASLYINLRHYGIPLRDDYYYMSAAKFEKTLRRMAETMKFAEIAAELKLTESYIKRKLREFNINSLPSDPKQL